MNRVVPLLLLGLVLGAGPGWSQSVDGHLEGRVLGSGRIPLAGVNITVSGPSLQRPRGASSDREGYFRIPALPVGSYAIRISQVDLQDVRFTDVVIQLGKTTNLGDVRLEPRVLELPRIVVSGEKRIDPSTTTLGANLNSTLFEALPTDRNFRSIVTLVPQANASFLGDGINIAGGTGGENIYYVDGIHVTDPYVGATSTNLPYNFIQEIEVKTGGYEAEYGRALGGIVNAVTRSGGNEFQGQLFGFFTNDRLAATRRRGLLESTSGEFSEYDMGIAAGGPLVRDRLWFYLAYNPSFNNADIATPGVGVLSDERTQHLLAGKLTWQIGTPTKVALTVLGDPSRRRGVRTLLPYFGTPSSLANPDPLLARVDEGGASMSLDVVHQAGKRVLLRGSVSHVGREQLVEPQTERGATQPTVIDLSTGTWSGGTGGFDKPRVVRTAGEASASILLDRHLFKVGMQYEDNRLSSDLEAGAGMSGTGFIFQAPDTSATWVQIFATGTIRNRVASSYAEDSWRVAERLKVNLGLRWEGQVLTRFDGARGLAILDEWQPRAGFIYQPGELGSQKIFGSYGRFYEQLPLLGPGQYFLNTRQMILAYDHNPLIDPSGADTTQISSLSQEVKDVRGEHFDEFTLGYEREVRRLFEFGVRATYRTLREVVDDAYGLVGNPGRGRLDFTPRPKRDYTALEITLQKGRGGKALVLASYVLSRNYGNYTGIANTDAGPGSIANAGPQFDFAEQYRNSTGLLPNDRTHVFKLAGSYQVEPGLTAGAVWTWETGTPLTEYGATPFGPPWFSFVSQRGTAGRTPPIWDLNLRLSYAVPRRSASSVAPKLILDLFHVFGQRTALVLDQNHYTAVDSTGAQIGPNPNYRKPILFQPPMSARVGAEIDF